MRSVLLEGDHLATYQLRDLRGGCPTNGAESAFLKLEMRMMGADRMRICTPCRAIWILTPEVEERGFQCRNKVMRLFVVAPRTKKASRKWLAHIVLLAGGGFEPPTSGL